MANLAGHQAWNKIEFGKPTQRKAWDANADFNLDTKMIDNCKTVLHQTQHKYKEAVSKIYKLGRGA